MDGHKILVFADVPHILKNVRNSMIQYDFILPQEVMDHNPELVSNLVVWNHIEQLHDFQKRKGLKLQPGINDSCFPGGNFDKMKVYPAYHTLSRATADALELCVNEFDKPKEWLTTAHFCRLMGRWFELMTSRDPNSCFSLNDMDKYSAHIEWLEWFRDDFFLKLTNTGRTGNQEKPYHKGVWLSTTSMIQHCDYYLKEKNFKFLLGGRFGSDCLENYFSQVRRRHRAPTPLYFRYCFKALIVLHHMKHVKKASYEEDDGCQNWLTELQDIKRLQLEKQLWDEDQDIFDIVIGDRIEKELDQEMILNYVVGYMFKKTICSVSYCEKCKDQFTQEFCDASDELKLIVMKCYTPDALTIPSKFGYQLFSMVESTFLENMDSIMEGHEKYIDCLIAKLSEKIKSLNPSMLTCHLDLLLRRFIKIRMHFHCRQLTVDAKNNGDFHKAESASGYSSKSQKGAQLH